MNSSGYEIREIFEEFVGKNSLSLNELNDYYGIDFWYPKIEGMIYTPITKIFPICALYNQVIDLYISKLPNNECFAKLMTISTEPLKPYKNSSEIISDIFNYQETKNNCNINSKIAIREWVYNMRNIFRCYICESTLRGISRFNEFDIPYEIIEEIRDYIKIIIDKTEYNDFCIDFCLMNDNSLLLIKISSPVYLFSKSGNFDLTNKYDFELLLGDFNQELTYPVIR